MLNRNQIVEILNEYNLDKTKYIVISGAAMVLLGIKEKTRDIDISVTKDYYDDLLKNNNCVFEKINKHNNKVYFIDDVINFGIDYYSTDYLLADDIRIQKPENIKKLKQMLSREKDKQDIKLIDKFLNK